MRKNLPHQFLCIAVLLPWLATAISADASETDLLNLLHAPLPHANPVLQDEHEHLLAAINTGNLELAAVINERIRHLIDETYARDHLVRAQPLIAQAVLDTRADRFAEAGFNLQRAIGLIELHQGIYSPTLVGPLTTLGIVNNRIGNYAAAIDTLQRSQHIVHRNEGVLSAAQIDILDTLTESHIGADGLFSPDAELAQQLAFHVRERQHGETPALLPALDRLARWHRNTQCFTKAEAAHTRAMGIIETHLGNNDLRLLAPLRGIRDTRLALRTVGILGSFVGILPPRSISATTMRRPLASPEPVTDPGDCRAILQQHTTFSLRPAARAMMRATAVAEADGSLDTKDFALLLTETGDMLLASNKRRMAADYYRRAWQLLSDEEWLVLRNELFAAPKRIFPVRLVKVTVAPPGPDQPDTLTAVVRFDVNERGDVRNISLIESNIGFERERRLKQVLQDFQFRPRLNDGNPVATPGLTLTQNYPVAPRVAPVEPSPPTEGTDATTRP